MISTSGRTPALVLLALLLCLLCSTAALATFPYPDSGIFVEHGYVCVPKADADIQAVTQWCQARSIVVQFLNVAGLNADGTMDPANYSELARYISVTRAYDPNQKLIVYLSGTLSGHVNNPATHQNIANVCRMFFDQYGVDGVNVDFEPFQADNQNYLSLYSLIRQTVGAGRHLSLDTTANPTWSDGFLYQVSTYFDWLCPMFYDTGYSQIADYQAWVIAGMHHHSDNMAPNCQTYPIIAAYRRSRWHNPAVENIQTGTDAIMQSISEGCTMHALGVWWRYEWAASDDTLWQTYWIHRFDGVAANFTGNPTSGVAPLTVMFTDTSTGGPTSWSWTFGDGGTSTAQNPSHVYNAAGSYTVALTATNAGGSNTNTKPGYISVSASGQPPVANFVGAPTSGTAPLAVSFTDQSTNAPTSWSWTFGDGGTSTAQNPSHTYTGAGSFTVALTATNQYGNNTNTKTAYITVTSGSGGDYLCNSLAVNNGTITSGDHTSVHSSDNVYLVLQSAKSGPSQYAQVTYTFNTPLSTLSSLSFTVEGKVSAGTQPQHVYLWNYSGNGTWDDFSTTTLTTTDSTVTQAVTGTLSNYLSGGVVKVKVKVGGNGSTAYVSSTDLVKITAMP